MDYTLGKRIKDLREHLKISQKELCDGICTQGLISRIEGDTATPTAPLLHQIAIRLGVDLNYFFDDISRNGIHYVKEAISHMDKHIRDHNYGEVMKTIQFEKKNPLFKKRHLQQYLLWREGICIFHMENDSQKALELLDRAFHLRLDSNKHPMTETEIDILASKAIVHSKINELDYAADIYRTLLSQLEALPLLKKNRLIIRILFNASRNAYDRNNYMESLFYADKAIKICIEEGHLYLLGHLLFQKGCSLFKHDPSQKEKSLRLLKEALWIYELNPVPEFIKDLNDEIQFIENSG
ncbi:helix-turn-helix domain-containing protein [Salipaludibacillus aurantiacus]|uniref:Helix-turn-helix domain-containing protein n=1 Tax=Salipaludibacillus aurantiacus TaxID=1601833 RepID=A0A1H9VJX6_9BACI|nr:helix-turn-helix domain-containing protein [Salipaludibacillus aurantiacus]SES21879.1 Helix-turn-helix domain-containing protein [Salipaludibacillus aurantiacus]